VHVLLKPCAGASPFGVVLHRSITGSLSSMHHAACGPSPTHADVQFPCFFSTSEDLRWHDHLPCAPPDLPHAQPAHPAVAVHASQHSPAVAVMLDARFGELSRQKPPVKPAWHACGGDGGAGTSQLPVCIDQ